MCSTGSLTYKITGFVFLSITLILALSSISLGIKQAIHLNKLTAETWIMIILPILLILNSICGIIAFVKHQITLYRFVNYYS